MRWEESKVKASLKTLMKKKGLQYTDLAQSLGVSAATIKRRLNKGELSLSQLVEMAECLGVSFYELVEMSRADDSKAYLFSEQQEQLFAKDLQYLLLFRALVMGRSFKELLKDFSVKEADLRKRLRQLENVQLIQLMPQDRISLLAKFPFRWREEGALQKAYFAKNLQALFEHARNEYRFSTYKEDTGALCKPFEYLLTSESQRQLGADLAEIHKKYMQLSQLEIKAKNQKATAVSGLLLADAFSIWQERVSTYISISSSISQ